MSVAVGGVTVTVWTALDGVVGGAASPPHATAARQDVADRHTTVDHRRRRVTGFTCPSLSSRDAGDDTVVVRQVTAS
jgi:hypothetical protein